MKNKIIIIKEKLKRLYKNIKINSKYIYYKYPEIIVSISLLPIRYIICTNIFILNSTNGYVIEKEILPKITTTVEDFFNNPTKVNKLVGHILGDGYLAKIGNESTNRTSNSSFIYSQTILRMNYFLKVQEFIKPLLTEDRLPTLKGLEIHGKTGYVLSRH